jgi:tRNA pseudouridine55 synthase
MPTTFLACSIQLTTINDMSEQSIRPPRREISGILLLDKPIDASSNRVLQRAKGIFSARKAGHTGNLDVLATGLLPICFGEATKVCGFLLDSDKSYLADIKLGATTTTGDREGEILREVANVDVTFSQVEEVLSRFQGEIEQIPPMYSALKRDGQRLYKLARKGIEIEREPRPVTIHKIELLAIANQTLSISVNCSKGTYIRTLAEDIGEVLECGAHVTMLRRTGAGPYSLSDAFQISDLEKRLADSSQHELLDEILLPLDTALQHFPDLNLSDACALSFSQGQAVRVSGAPSCGLVRLYCAERQFIGIGTVLEDGRIAPRRLMR